MCAMRFKDDVNSHIDLWVFVRCCPVALQLFSEIW